MCMEVGSYIDWILEYRPGCGLDVISFYCSLVCGRLQHKVGLKMVVDECHTYCPFNTRYLMRKLPCIKNFTTNV